MKVVLINPRSPYLENDASYPPMWAMYIAAKVEQYGHVAEIVDLTVDKNKQLDSLDADLFMVTAVTPNINNVLNLIEKLNPSIPVVIGGAHPTHVPIAIRPRMNVIIVSGEAEPIMESLLRTIPHGVFKPLYDGGIAKISEIQYKNHHGIL